MIQRLLLVQLALAVLAGCSSTRSTFVPPDIPSGFPNHDRRYIASAVESSVGSFHTIETKSRMRVETPDESRSVNLEIKFRREDTLLVNAKVILGIEAVRSLVTPDSFFVYDRLHKRMYRGTIDQAYRLLLTPTPLDEMFDSISGTETVDRESDWQVSHDSLYYYLSTADGSRSVAVDPRLWRVIRSEDRSMSGDLIERRTFSDFDSFGGFVVPRRIEVERPLKGERFQVYHRSVEVNPPSMSLHFDVGRIDEDIIVGQSD